MAVLLALVAILDPSFFSAMWLLFFIFLLWRIVIIRHGAGGVALQFALYNLLGIIRPNSPSISCCPKGKI